MSSETIAPDASGHSARRAGTGFVRSCSTPTTPLDPLGEDEASELYLTDLDGGAVYKLVNPGQPTPTPFGTATLTPTATRTPTPGTPTATPTARPGPRADLLITAFSANPTTSDRPIPVTVTVVNQGTASSGPGDSFDLHLFADLGRPPLASDKYFVGHIQVPALGAGASTTVSGEVFADALTPGPHTLWVLADGHDIVAESFEHNNSGSVPVTLGPPPSSTPPGQATVTFDDLAGEGQPLDGPYPVGVVEWGIGSWWLSGPFGRLTTKSVSFNASGVTSRTFTFVSPRRLLALDAYNGGSADTTVTLTCAG